MPDRKPISAVGWIAAVLLLIGGYVGVYYAVVQISPGYFVQRKEWRFGHRFFAPIHWLDRRMRPHVWQPPP